MMFEHRTNQGAAGFSLREAITDRSDRLRQFGNPFKHHQADMTEDYAVQGSGAGATWKKRYVHPTALCGTMTYWTRDANGRAGDDSPIVVTCNEFAFGDHITK